MATIPDTTAAELPEESHAKPPFLRRVKIRNYKSIAYCDVPLGPLTVIVGRNGSGKSNFLDALGFLRDATALPLREAVARHGGSLAIAHRGSSETATVMELDALESSSGGAGRAFRFRCAVNESARWDSVPGSNGHHRGNGAAGDRYGEFGEGFERFRTYNFHPDAIRQLQRHNPGGPLDRDGRNLADVFRQLRTHAPDLADRVRDYLAAITEQALDVWPVQYGEYETLRFKLDAGRGNPPLEFDAASMSDGTLRVLAALVAVFQVLPGGGHPSLVGIEEPETALHPAASRALVDALDEATMHTQVVITTHSADILDDPDLKHATILVARYKNGRTELAPVDAASREIVKRELDTYGGLQRTDQLEPDYDDIARQERDAK